MQNNELVQYLDDHKLFFTGVAGTASVTRNDLIQAIAEVNRIRRGRPIDEAVPAAIKDSLRRYIRDGIKPGTFLTAVLTNNLYDAILRADPTSLENMKEILLYVFEHCPMESFGSEEKLNKWVEKRRETCES